MQVFVELLKDLLPFLSRNNHSSQKLDSFLVQARDIPSTTGTILNESCELTDISCLKYVKLKYEMLRLVGCGTLAEIGAHCDVLHTDPRYLEHNQRYVWCLHERTSFFQELCTDSHSVS